MIGSAAASSEVYTWEPSNATIARRYGLRPQEVLRFDTNTSPAPPEFLDELLGGPFEPPLNEYPDSEYAALVEAAARYVEVEPREVIVGAGADEVLDLVAKAFLPAGGAAAVPVPTYAMFGVLTSQRGARVLAVPRLAGGDRFALDLERLVTTIGQVQVIWLCSPNNPTGTAEDPATIEAVLEASLSRPEPPLVVVDEAYHEFVGRTV
ncbi:MAG: aminotransferase class I/II-fold pyridoxal phosphate-dependent enzyme, partial [Chloroflexota bacterium]|nr:aminotransferase class I/II-fold pyridoxal phosphate-dependent enzyme [Chloroflexota bacterium]